MVWYLLSIWTHADKIPTRTTEPGSMPTNEVWECLIPTLASIGKYREERRSPTQGHNAYSSLITSRGNHLKNILNGHLQFYNFYHFLIDLQESFIWQKFLYVVNIFSQQVILFLKIYLLHRQFNKYNYERETCSVQRQYSNPVSHREIKYHLKPLLLPDKME